MGEFYNINIKLPDVFPNSRSTKKKTYDENMNDFEKMMVDELSKTINKNIIENIKNLKNEKRTI